MQNKIPERAYIQAGIDFSLQPSEKRGILVKITQISYTTQKMNVVNFCISGTLAEKEAWELHLFFDVEVQIE